MESSTSSIWLGTKANLPVTWSQAVLLFFLTYVVVKGIQDYRKTPNVPSVGFPAINIPVISSWIAAVRFMRRPVESVRGGVAKHNNGMFRIATMQGECVLVCKPELVAEYMKAPDSVLNFEDGANDQQQIPFTMGYGVGHRTYHTSVVRGPMTQNIPKRSHVMLDEINQSFTDLIGSPDEYKPVALYDTIAMVIARTTNRTFVGEEFYRNEAYLKTMTDYAQAVVISAELIRVFPEWMKPIVVKFMPVWSCRKKGFDFLGKLVQDRLDGKYEEGEKPADLLQSLLDAAPPVEKTAPQLVERLMALNVASIHTTTMTFTAALYSLAAEPDKYFPAFRAEVLEHLEDGEITVNTVNKLVKMDSFIRESARFNVSGLMAMQRNARQDFRFSDGTVIPRGAKVGTPSLILHRDPTIYENPDVFDGFRFAESTEGQQPKTAVNTGVAYHLFGHGRHHCPGRFFAIHEMKLMFATMLLRYDWKLAPGTAPKTMYIATMAVPDTKLEVLFKARADQ